MKRNDAEGENCPDCPTLAAFVDATLPKEQRDRIKTHLADCDRCLTTVTETLKTGEELTRIRRRPSGNVVRIAIPLALAASVALIILYPELRKSDQPIRLASVPSPKAPLHDHKSRAPTMPTTTGQLASARTPTKAPDLVDKVRAKAMPQETGQQTRLSSGRPTTVTPAYCVATVERLLTVTPLNNISPALTGQAPEFSFSSPVSDERRMFRLGALLVRLEIAERQHDAVRTEAIVAEMRTLTAGNEPPGLNSLSTQPDSPRGLASALEAIYHKQGDSFLMEFGAWVEGGYLASLKGNVSFVDPAEVRRFREGAASLDLPQGIVKSLDGITTITGRQHAEEDDADKLVGLFKDIRVVM